MRVDRMYPEDLSADETRSRTLALIDRLFEAREVFTTREWAVLNLYYKCNFTLTDIALVFDCSRPAVQQSLNAARRKAQGRRPYSEKPPESAATNGALP